MVKDLSGTPPGPQGGPRPRPGWAGKPIEGDFVGPRQTPPWPSPAPPIIGGPSETVSSDQALREGTFSAARRRIPLVYGTLRVGGDIIYGDLQTRPAAGGSPAAVIATAVVVLSEGEIDSVLSIWFGENEYPTGPSAAPIWRWQVYYGSTGQSACAWKIDGSDYSYGGSPSGPGVATVGDQVGRLPGLCYAVLQWHSLFQPEIVFPTFKLRGLKCADPRLGGVFVYTENPALIMANLKRDARFGDGVALVGIDWTSVTDAANYCDDTTGHPGRKAFECHIQIRATATVDEWHRTIGAHFGGRWQFVGGKWTLVVNGPVATTKATFTEDDFVEYPTLRRGTGAGLRDLPNRVTVEWTDPSTWRIRSVSVAGYEVESGGEIREGGAYKLHGCQNEAQAYAAAWRLYNQLQADLLFQAVVMPKHEDVALGDKVVLVLPDLGMPGPSGKAFAVTGVTRRSDDAIELEGLEYDDGVFTPAAFTPSALVAFDPGAPPWTPPPTFATVEWAPRVVTTWEPDTGGHSVKHVRQYPGIKFSLPPNSGVSAIAMRWTAHPGYPGDPDPTWDSMASSQVLFPPTGNVPPPEAGKFGLFSDAFLVEDASQTYYPDVSPDASALNQPSYYVQFRTVNAAGIVALTGFSSVRNVGITTDGTPVPPAGTNPIVVSPAGAGAGQTGELRFKELAANGSSHVGFKAPDALAASTIFELPDGDGSAGQAIVTNGSRKLSFATISGGGGGGGGGSVPSALNVTLYESFGGF